MKTKSHMLNSSILFLGLLAPSPSPQPSSSILKSTSGPRTVNRGATSVQLPSTEDNANANTDSRTRMHRRRSTLMSLPRMVVEQHEKEPVCILIFKWLLIIAGATMLGIVLFIMGEVIYAWTTGTLNESRSIFAFGKANRHVEQNATQTGN